MVHPESGIFKNPSKRWWAWLISFLGIGLTMGFSLYVGAHVNVQLALAVSMGAVSMTAIAGLAWVDKAVRVALAQKGVYSPPEPVLMPTVSEMETVQQDGSRDV